MENASALFTFINFAMRVDPNDIVGVAEIAEMIGCGGPVVVNRINRDATFPKPLRVLKSGPLYHKATVLRYFERNPIQVHVKSPYRRSPKALG